MTSPPTQYRTIYAGDYAFSEADVHGRAVAVVGVHVDSRVESHDVGDAKNAAATVNVGATNAANAGEGGGDATTKATEAGSLLL